MKKDSFSTLLDKAIKMDLDPKEEKQKAILMRNLITEKRRQGFSFQEAFRAAAPEVFGEDGENITNIPEFISIRVLRIKI
jgi:hypothetical protein